MPLHRVLAMSAFARTLSRMQRVVHAPLLAAAFVALGCSGAPGGDASNSEERSVEQPVLGAVSNFHVRLVEGPNGDHVLCDGRVRGLSGNASLYTVSLRITYPDASVTTRNAGINKASPTFVDKSDGEFQAELVGSPPASGTYTVRAFLKRATAFDAGTHQCRAIIEEVSVAPPSIRLLYGEGQATSAPTGVPAPYLTATSHRQSGTNMSCESRLNHANPSADYTVQLQTNTSDGADFQFIVASSSSPVIGPLPTTNGGMLLIERGTAPWSASVPSLDVRFDFSGPVGPSACAITIAETLTGTTVLSEMSQMSLPVCGDGIVNGDELCDIADPTTPCCGLDCKSVAPSGVACGADPDGSGCLAAPTCNGTTTFPASCIAQLAANGTPCTDDGLFCTGPETCQSGLCLSSGNPCPGPDGDADCAESCDEAGGTCSGADPDNSICDDGVMCAADRCQGGICVPHAQDDNAVCQNTFNLGLLSGDTGAGTVTDSWIDEEWDVLRLTEDNSVNNIYLSATVELQSPPGNDWDLCVYCANCGSPNVQCSEAGAGLLDTVTVRKDDTVADDDFNLLIQVYYFSATTCEPWNLTVHGNTNVLTATCP